MATSDKNMHEENIKRLQSYFGIGDLTVLTDALTRLAPIEEIRNALDVAKKLGNDKDVEKVLKAVKYIDEKGGKERIDEAIQKLEAGAGKPHCLFSPTDKKVALELAEVTATDQRIVFTSETQELAKLLTRLKLRFEDIKSLPLAEFQSTFRPVVNLDPNCKYMLRFVEKTDYVFARNHVEPIFYLRKKR